MREIQQSDTLKDIFYYIYIRIYIMHKHHAIEYLAESLKQARDDKKLSQRSLSRRTGVTQAKISQIEHATVDPQVSTLIKLARALDLEIMLVPRTHLTSITSLIRHDTSMADEPKPAYTLDEGSELG